MRASGIVCGRDMLRDVKDLRSDALLCLAICHRQLATARYPARKMTMSYPKRSSTAGIGIALQQEFRVSQGRSGNVPCRTRGLSSRLELRSQWTAAQSYHKALHKRHANGRHALSWQASIGCKTRQDSRSD